MKLKYTDDEIIDALTGALSYAYWHRNSKRFDFQWIRMAEKALAMANDRRQWPNE